MNRAAAPATTGCRRAQSHPGARAPVPCGRSAHVVTQAYDDSPWPSGISTGRAGGAVGEQPQVVALATGRPGQVAHH